MTLRRHSVPLPSERISWFRWAVILTLCFVAAVLVSGVWRPPVERAIHDVLAQYVHVDQVRVHSFRRVTLTGVRVEGGQAQAVDVHFSIPTLIKNGAIDAIQKIELIAPEFSSVPALAVSEATPNPDGMGGVPVALPSGIIIDIRDGRIFPDEQEREWLIDGELLLNSDGDNAYGSFRTRHFRGPGVNFNHAWIDFECEIQVLACSAHIQGSRGQLFHHPLIELAADVTVDDTGWIITRASGTGPAGNHYGISGRGAFGDGTLLELAIETEGTPVNEGLLWIEQDVVGMDAATGSLVGAVQLRWDAGDSLHVQGEGSIQDGKFADALIDSGNFRFETTGGTTIFSAELAAGPGRLSTEEFRVESGHIDGTIRMENFPVPTLARGVEGVGIEPQYFHKIGGRMNGTVRLEGSLETDFNTYIHLNSERLSYQSIDVAPFELDALWNPWKGWTIHDLRAHRIFGSGQGASFNEFDAYVHWEDLQTSWVERWVAVDVLAAAPGVSHGELAIRLDGTEISGGANFTVDMGTSPDPVIFQGEFTHALSEAGEVSGTVQTGQGRAWFQGSWDQDSRLTYVLAHLDEFPARPIAPWLGLPAVEALLTGEVHAWANGAGWNVDAHVTSPKLSYDQVRLENVLLAADVVSGAMDDAVEPCVGCMWGEGSFTAEITPSSAGQSQGSSLDVRLVLDGREARLNPVAVGLFGGIVRAEGRASFQEENGWHLDFQSSGSRLRYQNEGTTLDINFSGRLHGPLQSPLTAGQVQVSRGDIDLLRLPKFGGSAVRVAGPPQGFASRVGMDISVDIRNVQLHARSLLDAEIEGVLEVRGVVAQPEIYGSVDARRGMFRYGRTRFDLTEGRASFQGQDLFPRLDVIGEARVDGRTVEAGVTGRADDISLSFFVDGRADQQEALNLLRSGSPGDWDTNDWAGLGQALRAWLDEEFLSEAYWQLGRVLERAFDVDRFRLEQEYEEGDLRLDIGKYVTSDLYLSYRRSLLDPSRQDIGLEYSISPGVRIHSRWFGDDGPDVGLEMHFPF